MDNVVVDCIIPARAGSKGILSKNILLFEGHPLLAYSIAAAKLSNKINDVYVSTNSKEYAKIAENYGASVLYLRPNNISLDFSMDIDFFKYHIDFIKKNNLKLPNFFVNLRPTSPLRVSSVIDHAIEKFIACKDATSLRSAHKINFTPYKMFRRNGNYMTPYLLKKGIEESHSAPRQKFEDAFVGNGYIDVIKPNLVDESGKLYGDNIYLYETEIVSDLDGLQDLDNVSRKINEEKYKPLLNYVEGCKNK